VFKKVFISKQVSKEIIEDARQHGYLLYPHDMLHIDIQFTDETANQIRRWAQQDIDVFLSSQHAVKAVHKILNNTIPSWRIYCINGATEKSIIEWLGHRGNIQASAENMRTLLPQINIPASTLYHISGDFVRPDLDNYCTEHHKVLKRAVVYKSRQNTDVIKGTFDAYLFCSPRSVEAFMLHNRMGAEAIAVSIGPSTTEKLQEYSIKTIIESQHPDEQAMLTTYYHYDQK